MIIVKDESIPYNLMNLVGETVFEPKFHWYMTTTAFSTVSYDYDRSIIENNSNIKDTPQLVHSLLIGGEIRSAHFHFFTQVVNYALDSMIGEKASHMLSITRAKLNLLTRSYLPETAFNPPHTDPFITDQDYSINLLYYVNSADGNTRFFDGVDGFNITQEVRPEQGKAVLFDNDHYHASSPPSKSMARVVLNVNLGSPLPLSELYKYKEEEET